ncbi:MAG: molybdopterin-dependent oxidoreductase, partial [Rhodospirillales bacterium]|nr:molybdopterin-dependent oxidoreductase [Rhodospirillales bacterium]
MDTHNNRVTGVPMEPRAALAHYDEAAGSYLLEAGSQGVGSPRNALAAMFGVAPKKMRVISRDVGGGYGTRNIVFPEFVMAIWAAKRLGRPVKWSGERAECFFSDPAARDVISRAELALDAEGNFLAVRVVHLVNFGVEAHILLPFARSVDFVVGVYDLPAAYIQATGVFTNRGSISVLRSAGRPEPMFLIERLIDLAAAQMDLDGVELRRRNIIPPITETYLSATDVPYDSGHFGKNMEEVLKLADWDGSHARKAGSVARGRLRGIGMANYIEWATGVPEERVEVEIKPGGEVEVVAGTMDSGQGHATAYAQVMAELLGVPFDQVQLVEGDSDRAKFGNGSHSSRSMRLASTLMKQCADEIIEKGREIAAQMLE